MWTNLYFKLAQQCVWCHKASMFCWWGVWSQAVSLSGSWAGDSFAMPLQTRHLSLCGLLICFPICLKQRCRRPWSARQWIANVAGRRHSKTMQDRHGRMLERFMKIARDHLGNFLVEQSRTWWAGNIWSTSLKIQRFIIIVFNTFFIFFPYLLIPRKQGIILVSGG